MSLGEVLFWTAAGFLLGAMPFAVWLGDRYAHLDVRDHGDGNPGAFNAWHMAGPRLGLAVLFLDFFKGALPVGLAHVGRGLDGWAVVPVAIAPIMGHAFSPFLNWRGGKSITVTFGVWTGLGMPWAPIFLGGGLSIGYFMRMPDRWALALAMLALLVYIVVWHTGWPVFGVWLLNTAIFWWKFRRRLAPPVRFGPLGR